MPAFLCAFNTTSPHSHQLSLMVIELYWSLLSVLIHWPDYLVRLRNGTWLHGVLCFGYECSCATSFSFHGSWDASCSLNFVFGEGSLLGVLCGLSNWCVLPVVMGETGTEHGTELVEKRHAISLMYSTYFGKQVGGQTKSFKEFPFWIKGLRKKMT